MRYTPVPQSRAADRIAVLLFGGGLSVFLLGGALPAARAIFQLAAMACAVGGLYLLLRYRLTAVSYRIEEGELFVYKSRGRTAAILEARLSLTELSALTPLGDGAWRRDPHLRAHPDARVYDYTVSLRGRDRCIALFTDPLGGETALLVELGGEMREYLMKKAEENKAGKPS